MYLLKSLFFLLLSFAAFAHQPVINNKNPNNPYLAYVIEKPEISKAIYSTLQGDPHYYLLSSDKKFNFYVGITVPKIDNCTTFKKFSFNIIDIVEFEENIIEKIDGNSFKWWSWFEPYGKKWYWIGPEIGAEFKSTTVYEPGEYYIKVFNESNTGNYVLATGDIEKFGPLVIAQLPFIMPKVNKFWDEKNCVN
tara:strand:+ start:1116 stop:1694 length:579 start_codon:yes stop_codon:yes gene_type:complete